MPDKLQLVVVQLNGSLFHTGSPSFGRLLGVRGLVTALVQGVVDSEIRCTKAVTSPRTPRRRPKLKGT